MSIPVADRFRAIITGPLSGSPGPSDCQQNGYEFYGDVRFQDASVKRKKEHDDDVVPRKTVRRTLSDDEGGSIRETVSYKDRESMLKAMQDRFKQGPHVDFHGTYEINDPGSNHKARIKSMAIEIWKATGYRFTVKDHPQFSNGHKTRFWCSQDEAHRSKSSRAARKTLGDLYKPRQSSSGECLAKNRFPCRSRLLISSRDSNTPGRPVITVRMHHHAAHEPYADVNLPPEIAQNLFDGYWTMKGTPTLPTTSSDEAVPMNDPQFVHALHPSSERAVSEDSHQDQEAYDEILPELPNNMPNDMPQELLSRSPVFTQLRPPPASHSTAPQTPTLPLQNSDIYHRRMLSHIRNLRDFCDGLEFQLQFNDYRMLEVVEREGAQFLDLVTDCLNKEGRLVATDQRFLPHTHASNHHAQPDLNGVDHVDQPVLAALQMRAYEANTGIDPDALAH